VYLGYETESVFKKNIEGKNHHNNSNNDNSNTFHVVAKSKSSGKLIEIDSDQLLVAVGRVPNTDIIDIQKTGVKVNEKGFIMVDEYLETNICFR
jgi:mycothione reductase